MPPPLKRLRFHPFFRVALVQMMRRGEAEATARLAASEVRKVIAARRKRGAGVEGAGGDASMEMVPLRERVRSMEQKLAREGGGEHGKAKDKDHGCER